CIHFFEELLRDQPKEPRFVRNLAHLLIDRSAREGELGRSFEMEQAAHQASALCAILWQMPDALREPFDPLFYAMAENNLALSLREQGRFDNAMTAHDKALELMIGMTKANGNRNGWSFLHRVQTERAWTMARSPANHAAAIAELKSAIEGWK